MYEIPLKAKVIVKCPDCGARVCDVIKGTKGCIEIKCPDCKKVSRIEQGKRNAWLFVRVNEDDNSAEAIALMRLFSSVCASEGFHIIG